MFRPFFERGSILKQGMLEALRDYPYQALKLLYGNYGDGVISGFDISLENDTDIVVSPGIVKSNGQIYLSTGELHLEQKYETNYVYLDINHVANADGEDITLNLFQSVDKKEQYIELFRYTKNATLYKFQSIEEAINPPMNRVNIVNQKHSVQGGETLSDECFALFAKEILDSKNPGIKDVAFAYQCLNGIDDISLVNVYFDKPTSNIQIIESMKKKISILNKEESVRVDEPAKKERPRQMIVT